MSRNSRSRQLENHSERPIREDKEFVLSETLRNNLNSLVLTKTDIAERLGVSTRTIRQLMNGYTTYTKYNFADRICTEFGFELPKVVSRSFQVYCGKCGIEVDKITEGCTACLSRHTARKKSRTNKKDAGKCKGCGRNYSKYRKGCKVCTTRKRNRRLRAVK